MWTRRQRQMCIRDSQGDVDRGKKLFGEVGCLACHANADFEAGEIAKGELGWKDPRIPNAGPELNQMGSKVTQEWLYSWVKDPKHYWEGTLMPSLKLSEQEAMDIASYLMTKRNQAFEAASAPVANPKKRDEVVMSISRKRCCPKMPM